MSHNATPRVRVEDPSRQGSHNPNHAPINTDIFHKKKFVEDAMDRLQNPLIVARYMQEAKVDKSKEQHKAKLGSILTALKWEGAFPTDPNGIRKLETIWYIEHFSASTRLAKLQDYVTEKAWETLSAEQAKIHMTNIRSEADKQCVNGNRAVRRYKEKYKDADSKVNVNINDLKKNLEIYAHIRQQMIDLLTRRSKRPRPASAENTDTGEPEQKRTMLSKPRVPAADQRTDSEGSNRRLPSSSAPTTAMPREPRVHSAADQLAEGLLYKLMRP